MAAALNTPVSLLATASEGGSWGIAVLGAYMLTEPMVRPDLATYLKKEVFCRMETKTMTPDPEDVEGFERYMQDYREGLALERLAGERLQSRRQD